MYLIHPLVSLPAATMVSVSPVHLPSGPQELHVHEDCVCEYLMRQNGLQQVDVVLETVFNFSRDSEQLVGVTSSVMLILLDSIFDHNMLFQHINYS